MGLFTLLLIAVVVLAVMGIGWKTFSVGVISGFDRVINIGKELTQEAKEIVNDPTLTLTNSADSVFSNRY